jgi:hypothetical protein
VAAYVASVGDLKVAVFFVREGSVLCIICRGGSFLLAAYVASVGAEDGGFCLSERGPSSA